MSKCPYDPQELAGTPMGMLHCPECGEMIVAGMPHPDYDLLDNLTEEDYRIIAGGQPLDAIGDGAKEDEALGRREDEAE
jgi:hypothetical protein